MRAQSGNPKLEASQSIPNVPYARYAELIGLKGIFVDDPDRIGAAWDQALRTDCPLVLEAMTDPNVPPLPPHITLKHAKAFASTLIKGDPDETSVISQSLKQFAEELL
jgi:pyruvate dehydrogenase (quinone)